MGVAIVGLVTLAVFVIYDRIWQNQQKNRNR